VPQVNPGQLGLSRQYYEKVHWWYSDSGKDVSLVSERSKTTPTEPQLVHKYSSIVQATSPNNATISISSSGIIKNHCVVQAIIRPQKVFTLRLLAGADLTLDGIDFPLRILASSPSLSFHNGYGPDIDGRSEERRVEGRSPSRPSAWRTLLVRAAAAPLRGGDKGNKQGVVEEGVGEAYSS